MMKYRKILTLFAGIIMAFGLTACHGNKETHEFAIPESFDTSKIYNISFWAKNDTNMNQVNAYKNAIEEFEKLYPNIKVSIKPYTDYGMIFNDVITNIATDTTPNVCITYPDHIATYMTGENVVVPLDSLFENEKYGFGGSELKFDGPTRDELIPEFLDECSIGGAFYAIPFMRSTEVCYINKDYVEKLGYEVPDVLTWDYIFEVSEKAMEKDTAGNFKVNGQNVLIPFIYKSTDNMLISMLKQKGAGYSTSTGQIELFNDETKEILFEVAKHGNSRAFSTFKISSYPANFLNAGQCIFAIDSTAGATWMGSDAPLVDIAKEKLVQFETVVRPIPQYDTNDLKMISQGPSLCIFNKEDPNEVLASWLFAQFMLTNDVQLSYSETEGYIPVTSKAQQSDAYKEYLSLAGTDNDEHYQIKIDVVKLFMENTSNTFVTPVFNGSASLRNAAGQLIEMAVSTARKNKPVDDEYIETAYDKVTSLYRLDQIEKAGGSHTISELGPLPSTARVMIAMLAIAWVFILLMVIVDKMKSKKKKK